MNLTINNSIHHIGCGGINQEDKMRKKEVVIREVKEDDFSWDEVNVLL